MSDVILCMVGAGAAVTLLLVGGLVGFCFTRCALTGRKLSSPPRAVQTDGQNAFGLLGRLSGLGGLAEDGGGVEMDAEAQARQQELMRFLSYDGGEFPDRPTDRV